MDPKMDVSGASASPSYLHLPKDGGLAYSDAGHSATQRLISSLRRARRAYSPVHFRTRLRQTSHGLESPFAAQRDPPTLR